jgi:endo-1,4-beta-D-glucanase Y
MRKNPWLVLSCLVLVGLGSLALTADPVAPPEIEGQTVYIPFPVGIVLDGKLEDWQGVPVQTVARGPYPSKDPAENGSFRFSVASDATNFYIQMTSVDQNLISAKHGNDYWNEDSLEFYLNTTTDLVAKSYKPGIIQVSFSPADIGNTDPTKPRHFGQNYANLGLQGFVFKTSNGWGFEALIPLANLNVKAVHGLELGFQAQANGASLNDRNVKLIWSLADKNDTSYQNPSLFGRAIFYAVGNQNVPTAAVVTPVPTTATVFPVKPSYFVTQKEASVKSGQYRNLFAELGMRPSEINAKLEQIWDQFVNGADDQRLYYPVGTDEAYIYAEDSNDVRSEGQSYGMMIAVQLNKRTEFDRLWKWTKNHMQFKSGDHQGYFCWSVRPNGTSNCSSNASDGEAWIITSLFMAANRWADDTYRAEAQAILDTARSKDAMNNESTDLFNRQTKLITFVANLSGGTFTDPSYMVPAFLELWAVSANKDQAFWKEAAVAARAFWKTAANSETGLMSDYANYNGTPYSASFNPNSSNYLYDARRVHMNIAIDWQWFQADPWQQTQEARVLDFFHAQGVQTHGATYRLNGDRLSNNHEAGHTAMLATAALAVPSSNLKAWEFVNYLWQRPIPTGKFRYYDGLLYMLGMLNASGNFRYYGPKIN